MLNNQSIYIQIRNYIIKNILLDKYKPDELPSIRNLSMKFSVNIKTVQQAYKFLQDNNIVFTSKGRGFTLNKNSKSICKKMMLAEFKEQVLPQLKQIKTMLDIDYNDIEIMEQELNN